jgi:hypothetical protein
LHGVPTPDWLGLWRRHLFPERAGPRRGAEQGLRARQRLGAKDRTAFLPRLRFHGVLVLGILPGPYRDRLWRVPRSVDALAPCIRVGDDTASLGDLRSRTPSLWTSTRAGRRPCQGPPVSAPAALVESPSGGSRSVTIFASQLIVCNGRSAEISVEIRIGLRQPLATTQ